MYNAKNFHWLNRKLDLERTMNGLEKPFIKKSDPKNWRNSKNQSEICEQKTTSEKANFCSNTVFSLYFEIRAKKFHAAKPLAFSLHFLFRRDQNHYSNLTSKIMKMCEQILKKRQRPNTIQILWIVKNQEKVNNSPSYHCAAIKEENLWFGLSIWRGVFCCFSQKQRDKQRSNSSPSQ